MADELPDWFIEKIRAVMDEEIKQRMYALRAQFREEQAAKKAKKHAKNARKSKA